MGQLIREDNRATNKSYVYAYDAAGNITSKKTYAFTTGTLGTLTGIVSFGYSSGSWGDQLTSLSGIDSIRYDAVGNPLQIGEAYVDGTDIQLTWKGRELQSYTRREMTGMDDDGNPYYDSTTYSYTYNSDGIRTSKTVNGITHEYILNGSQIVAET